MCRFVLVLVLCASAFLQLAMAVEPDEILADPVLEERAREISKSVRCVVCQNEPIDSSTANLARQLRLIVRERLVAGDDEAEIKAFLVERYGDFILFEPPVRPDTWLLWYGPLAVLGFGVLGAFFYFRTLLQSLEKSDATECDLSQEEEVELTTLLRQEALSDHRNRVADHKGKGETP